MLLWIHTFDVQSRGQKVEAGLCLCDFLLVSGEGSISIKKNKKQKSLTTVCEPWED